MKKFIVLALLCAAAQAQKYTKDGGIALPDYRKWVHLGSGLGMTYTEQTVKNPPFTNVYAAPEAYESFLKNGVWPNKTVLVAEMRASETGVSINKSGYVLSKLIAVEVEVKDAAQGGWAFYGFEKGAQTGTGRLFPKTASCYSCHADHAAVDNTFVQFYPTLIETAKSKGTYKER